jgi:hypothetical protein
MTGSASGDAVDACRDESAAAAASSCPMLNVLGTEASWQGKRFYVVNSNKSKRGVLQILHWPIHNILRQAFIKGGIQQLYMIAMTSRDFRDAALRLIEQHAEEEITRLYFSDKLKQQDKFLESFGFFGWALNVKQKLPAQCTEVWSAHEIDAAYDHLRKELPVDEVSHLNGLKPLQAMRWKIEGRRALGDFISDCISRPSSWRKVLFHYNRAWKLISHIISDNAMVIKSTDVNGRCCVKSIDVSWPTVKLILKCSNAHNAGVWAWSQQEVYNWFRVKKFPVTGLFTLDVTGSQLVRLFTLGSPDIFTLKPPAGLGMSAAQFQRFKWHMSNQLLVQRDQSFTKTISFRVCASKVN